MLARPDKWLFICSANLARSPTAEYLARKAGMIARSCGTGGCEPGGFTVAPLTEEILRWADVIVCMKDHQRKAVEKARRCMDPPWPMDSKKIFVWELDDDWGRPYRPGMLEIIERRLLDTRQQYEKWREGKAGRQEGEE